MSEGTPAAQAGSPAVEAITKLQADFGYLLAAVTTWEARLEDKPDAQARRAANDAMDLIDDTLAGLHALRQRLVSEIRTSDDASARRVDALLARTADAMTSSSDQASPRPAGPGDNKAGRSNARPQQEGK